MIIIRKMPPPRKNQKINFWTLFEKFKLKAIRHFLIATIWTVLHVFIIAIISNIIDSGEAEVGNNYTPLLPKQLQKFFPSLTLQKFAFIGLILVCFYALTVYFVNLWEEELKIRAGHYVKNRLLDKFRQLPFEEKRAKSKEINTLVEFDSGEIGYTWEHLPNHVYHCVLTIFLVLFFRWGKFKDMSTEGLAFSFFWLLLINIVSVFFTRLVLSHEKKYKAKLTKEWEAQNKEVEKATLIESMGLTPQYREKQRKIMQKNENLLLFFTHAKSLNKTIPGSWLAETFPYLLLLLIGAISATRSNLLPMWIIFENFREVFRCFWEYGEYSSSLSRVNNFLALPEKNDNLQGIILPKISIKAVAFEKVSFKYKNSHEWILENYTHTFSKGKVNLLLGENGIGKSTILYLILGMLQPQQGKILIICENDKIYNLKEINLKHWRENNVAYASHDNLIEEGSTGQRQLANIKEVLKTKKAAEIFLFDEADNALDQEKQKNFEANLENLARNKLLVYTKH